MTSTVMTDKQTAVVNNAVTGNIFAGKEAEFLMRPTHIVIAVVAVLTGTSTAASGVFLTLSCGGRILVEDQLVPAAPRIFPVMPDDVLADAVVVGRLIGKYRNANGASVDIISKVNLTPI